MSGWQRSDRALPPDTSQDVQHRQGRPAIGTTTGEKLRRIISVEGRRYWWHPWVSPRGQLTLRPPVPMRLDAAGRLAQDF
jgi:hypothetical protein